MEIIINRNRPRFKVASLAFSQPLVIPKKYIEVSGSSTFDEIMTLLGYDLTIRHSEDDKREIEEFRSRLNNMDKNISVEATSKGEYISIAIAENMISRLWDECSDREDEYFSYWNAEIRLATLKRISGGIFVNPYLSLLKQGETETDEAKAYSASKINEDYESVKIFVDEVLKVETLKSMIASELAWEDNQCKEFKWKGVTYYSYWTCL